ncbi:MAG: vanadium-dependent haloperoxidase, partial [Ilumatobacteraceae bacterium]
TTRAARRAVFVAVAALFAASCGSDDGDDSVALDDCERTVEAAVSVARTWNEVLLDAIRRDFPAPTMHGRNLYHVSAGMWDAWAAYDDTATGVYVDEDRDAGDIATAREEAISYAAYRILAHRYVSRFGAEETLAELDETMAALGLPTDYIETEGDDAAAFGNRVAAAIVDGTIDDGSNELNDFEWPAYAPVNEPMLVIAAGTEMNDPNRWQPLAFEDMATQNGLELDVAEQEFVTPHWGYVTPFALPPAPENGVPIDPGPPPWLNDQASDVAFREGVVEVIEFSSVLDPTDGELVDISPATDGNNPLGTYDGTGYDVNPVTGEPYEPNIVPRGDFGRVLAEFWADGPNSETPPGHWNTLANAVADDADAELRVGGEGDPVDRLEWDVKMYLALNGAMHDSAVAAWGAKGYYDYVRPISMIRDMGGLGQSSDTDGPSYHPDGLPLVPGLIEVVTEESSAEGERHARLARRQGEIAIRTWAGDPGNPETGLAGVDWIRAVKWVPYQKPTFVTPAFAGYVSGHSTFSRAGAEVLTELTGSEYFPGGLGEWTFEPGYLEFEAGPEDELTLQWATYQDAADQAGISRLYGGIHVRADDLPGREMGAEIGQLAWDHALTYFDGSADR